MHGLVLEKLKEWPKYTSYQMGHVNDDEVIVDVHASSLNHRDLWITKGMYPGIALPIVLGSDGAGIYDGKKVLINPNIKWGSNKSFQSSEYEVLGLPTPGTFANQIVIPKDRLHHIPSHLTMTEAAALPLTGLTAYRALITKGRISKGDNVLIHGIGGGVALMAFQLALSKGANVYVTSSSAEKLSRAESMGAQGGINYTDKTWIKNLQKISDGIDIVIDGASGDGVGALITVCNPGARYVIYGGSTGKMNNISPQILFWKQISLLGSTMGSDKEFIEMLDLVSQHKIVPVVDEVIKLSDGHLGFDKMAAGQQFGKIVFNHRP